MAAFEYLALDPSGRQQKGVLEADSARQVRQLLRERQLAPLDVKPTRTREQSGQGGRLTFARGLSARDLALVTRQLATLVQAALPIEEALRAAARSPPRSASSRCFSPCAPRSSKATAWPAACASFPPPFPSCTGRRWLPASMPGTSARCWSNCRLHRAAPAVAAEDPAGAALSGDPDGRFAGHRRLPAGYVVPDVVRCSSTAGRPCRC